VDADDHQSDHHAAVDSPELDGPKIKELVALSFAASPLS
jgi:hypothetical protein